MAATRIAVVGAGLIGRAHVAAVRACPGAVLHVVVDPTPAAAAWAASQGVSCLPTLDALLGASVRPDGIVIATPNPMHVPQALQCLAAGIPVLVEKPLATSVPEGERLVAAAREGGVPVLVGHHRAHSPIMARARQVVTSGALGRIVAVSGSATFLKPDHYFDEGPWRREPGGGPILINLIHEVHNLRMLCGEIVEVQALSSNALRGFAVEDTAVINLRFASGALGSFVLSDTAASPRSWEQTTGENPSYDRHDDEDCYVIAGTLGSLAVPTMRLKTYPGVDDRSWWKPLERGVVGVVRDDPLKRQMAHFAAVARREAEPLVGAIDGLQNLRVTEAIAEAARCGRRVPVAS